jgi:hypothetical protein
MLWQVEQGLIVHYVIIVEHTWLKNEFLENYESEKQYSQDGKRVYKNYEREYQGLYTQYYYLFIVQYCTSYHNTNTLCYAQWRTCPDMLCNHPYVKMNKDSS